MIWFLSLKSAETVLPANLRPPSQDLTSVSFPETRSGAVDLLSPETSRLASGVLCYTESLSVFLVGFSLPGLPRSLSSHPAFINIPSHPLPCLTPPPHQRLIVFLPSLTLHPSFLFALPQHTADLLQGPSTSSSLYVMLIPTRLTFHEMPI